MDLEPSRPTHDCVDGKGKDGVVGRWVYGRGEKKVKKIAFAKQSKAKQSKPRGSVQVDGRPRTNRSGPASPSEVSNDPVSVASRRIRAVLLLDERLTSSCITERERRTSPVARDRDSSRLYGQMHIVYRYHQDQHPSLWSRVYSREQRTNIFADDATNC